MITKCLQRWSLFASLLFLVAGMVNPCQGEATQLPRKGASAAPGTTPQVVCTDERITVKAKSVPLETILDSIAKACRLRILSPSAEKSKTMTTVDFNVVELADVLDEMLRGCDYLVVYNEARENTGFVASVAQINQHSPVPETEPAVATEYPKSVVDEKQAQADSLRNQIEVLNERIASGVSDRDYQRALKIRRPEFVTNDRKKLAQYQRELAVIEQR